MKVIYFLAALAILSNSCGNNNSNQPVAEDDSAVNMTYSWEASLNDSTQRLEMKKAEAISQQRMSGFTAGMGLPPGMKLPF